MVRSGLESVWKEVVRAVGPLSCRWPQWESLPLASAADHLLETCDQVSTHGTADTAVVHLDDVLLTTDSVDSAHSKVSEINLALSLHYLAGCV